MVQQTEVMEVTALQMDRAWFFFQNIPSWGLYTPSIHPKGKMIAITFANRRRLSLRLLHVGTGKLLDKVRYLWPWCPKIGIVGPLLLNKDPVWNWSCWKSSLRNHGCYWKGWRVKGRGGKMFLRHGGIFFAENEKLEDVVWGFQELEREASSRWYNTLLLQFQNVKECCWMTLWSSNVFALRKVDPWFRNLFPISKVGWTVSLFPKKGGFDGEKVLLDPNGWTVSRTRGLTSTGRSTNRTRSGPTAKPGGLDPKLC